MHTTDTQKLAQAYTFIRRKRDTLDLTLSGIEVRAEVSKSVSLLGVLIGLIGSSTNPLTLLVLFPSAVCYLLSVSLEFNLIGRFEPFPFINKSVGELITGAFGANEDEDLEETPKAQNKILLKGIEYTEYDLLHTFSRELAILLAQSEQPFELTYQVILDGYHDHGIFPDLSTQDNLKVTTQETPQRTLKSGLNRLKKVIDLLPPTKEATPLDSSYSEPYEDTPESVFDDTLEETNSLTFDVAKLADINTYPFFTVIAPPGSGKTVFVNYLLSTYFQTKGGSCIAFDPFFSDWPDFNVLHLAGDIDYTIDSDLSLIEKRTKAYSQDKTTRFNPLIRLIDETPVVFSSIVTTSNLDKWLNYFRTYTRKINGRLILVSAELNATSLRISASTRDSSTILFPGKAGCQLALNDRHVLGLGTNKYTEAATQLRTKIANLNRPCLVYDRGEWSYFEIPELNGTPKTQTEITPKDLPQSSPNSLTPEETSIHAYCKTLGFFSVRTLVRKGANCTKGLKTPQIRQTLDSLVRKGYADKNGDQYFVRS